VGELVDILRAYRHEAERRKTFAARVMTVLRTKDDSFKPYDHPYYWAPFVMVGV